ncbi:MAG TPA: peptide chain release factor N(5)-glutamine methyltransferase [Thermohalobaculum sp.]|nr:peptide chain release factor N(5)-glutamine methyltransferase [Thermohalobaculum sp.]
MARAELIARAAARLGAAGVPEPGRDARLLYRWAARIDGPGLAATLRDPARPHEIARFEHAVAARAGRAPLSHIVGGRLFWGRRFRVTPDVLDPRPETETLIAHALEGPPARRILDLGTGSGCILLTLLAEWPEAAGLGVDISAAALAVARQNARALGLAGRAGFRQGDWCGGLAEPFDLVVANPPYVSEAELAALEPEVREHEPRLALAGGPDGLDAVRRIAAGVGPLLSPGGRLMLEIGSGQGPAAAAILAAAGLACARIVADLDGRDRVAAVSHPEKTA